MIRKTLLASLMLSIPLFFSGCYVHQNTIPKGLFNDVSVFQKPLDAQSEDDILKSYIELYTAYKNNLLLIETIEKLQK